jgi:hypothetical protein
VSKISCSLLLAGCCAVAVNSGAAHAQPKSAPKVTSPASPAPTTTTTPPAAVIGVPMTRPPAVAPLSPQQVTATPVSGGTVRNDKLASPTGSSISPSELAQSTAGGGGWGLEACMGYWDRGTHMTKSEWRRACERSARRLDNLKIDDLSLGLPKTEPPGRRRSHGPRPS